jgi:hypothetical protein
MLTILEYLWAIFFIGLLCVCSLLAAFAVVQFFCRVIQIFKPDFGKRFVPPERERDRTKVTPQAAKKIALDFIFAESMRRRKINVRREYENLTALSTPNVKNDAVEFSLEELRQVVTQSAPKKAPVQQTDLWTIISYPHGPTIPYFLITKWSQKNVGLRIAMSPSPRKRLTMDKDSAVRWCNQLGEGYFFAPANAEARLIVRAQAKAQTQEAKHATA